MGRPRAAAVTAFVLLAGESRGRIASFPGSVNSPGPKRAGNEKGRPEPPFLRERCVVYFAAATM